MTDIVEAVSNNEEIEFNWCVDDDYPTGYDFNNSFHYATNSNWYESEPRTEESTYDNKVSEPTMWLLHENESNSHNDEYYMKSSRIRTCSGSTTGSTSFLSDWIDPSTIILNSHGNLVDYKLHLKNKLSCTNIESEEEDIDVVSVNDGPVDPTTNHKNRYKDNKNDNIAKCDQISYRTETTSNYKFSKIPKIIENDNNETSPLLRDKGRDKINHRTIERKRRLSLHICFEKLKSELPFSVNHLQNSSFMNIVPTRISRVQVLTTAKSYIETLNLESKQLVEKFLVEKRNYQQLLDRLHTISSDI